MSCASLPYMSIMSRIVTGDGIDITSSQDVEVKNCFIRSTDDSICIKSQRLFEDPSTVRDVTKVRVHNNVIWNAEPGNAIELGYALQSEIHDLVFEDCDIIHCQYEGNRRRIHQWAAIFGIHNRVDYNILWLIL